MSSKSRQTNTPPSAELASLFSALQAELVGLKSHVAERDTQMLRRSGKGPRFLIRDRDCKFGTEFDRAAQALGTRVIKTAVRTPDMNATCERFLGSVRRECLDHVIVLSERHLLAVLAEYVRYFNHARPHQGLSQNSPSGPRLPKLAGEVIAFPVLGGIHHDYRRAA